jgi:hypothetical protein
MAVTMKDAVFWDVAPCGFIINRRFGGTFRLQQSSNILLCSRYFFYPEDGGDTLLRNVGLY